MDSLHLALRTTPADFGDTAAERAAIDDARALLDLSDHDVLDVCGADRLTYLHTKLTQHALRFAGVGGGYTVVTDIDGKLLFDAWCYALDDRVRMLLRPGTAKAAIEHLDRYVIMEDVTFERPELCALAIGATAAASLPGDPDEPWRLHAGTIDGVSVEVATLPHLTAGPLHVVFAPTAQVAQVADALAANGAVRAGTRALAQHQVANGIASVPRDVPLGVHIPLEAGLFHAIHFSKGCYLGQEVIERLFSRGRPNKRLMMLTWIGGAVAPGTAVKDGDKDVGVVTASFDEPDERGGVRTRALGYLRRKYLPPDGKATTVDGHEVTVGAYVGGETVEV